MVIVSDTTPIITLLKINQLELLRDLFGVIYIPDDVYNELIIDDRFENEVKKIKESNYIIVKHINKDSVENIMKETTLDRGESAAICLYETQTEAAVLLIDEKKGRKIARKRNIKIIGTVGLLALSYKKGIKTKTEIINIVNIIKEKRKCYSSEILEDLLSII